MKKDISWKLTYNRFSPNDEGLRESLCTLGNGYMGIRGAVTEAIASDLHYPGTYIAGVFNRTPTVISGKIIYNDDMVNCPNWMHIVFRIGNGRWFCPSSAKLISYNQELDMHKGVLIRKIKFQTPRGQKTTIQETRLVHMVNPHIAAIQYEITPENYSDIITVRTMLDGTVENLNVERYRELNTHHFTGYDVGQFAKNGVFLKAKTTHSKVEICIAEKVKLYVNDKERKVSSEVLCRHRKQTIGQEFRIAVKEGQKLKIEKTVSIYTSKDEGCLVPQDAAIKTVTIATQFKTLFDSHQKAWGRLWDKFDIKIEGHLFAQRVLRLHMFHLLQTASIHNTNIDAGLPARGLHGEAYRGHIFWDELFVIRFYSLNYSEIAKSLLLYRYKRLPRAREYAKEHGYSGAMFPWQSGATGREETQIVHLNPLSGKWGPDFSSLQRHVSLAIAYNVWRHWRVTGDLDFLVHYGAELLLSIAQFFASLVYFDKDDGRYHSDNVMGPDEFHEKLPGSKVGGLTDNAYSNIMVSWMMDKAFILMDHLEPQQRERILNVLSLTKEDLDRWARIMHGLSLHISKEGVIEQFRGYFGLGELDWDHYREQYEDIHRLDRILKAEGKSPDDYKLSKQPDFLMGFYNIGASEVTR
ncbi:MAG: glycoside hydrolase family 65 protein, partial [Candidatus Heimdallarchaeota archaeon]|nr:glycoside hydrolase family 65 protein [Candidatus Heimdallarchaeota archaeon]